MKVLTNIALCFLFLSLICCPQISAGFWEIEAIDTMKFSRDISREKDIIFRIPTYVKKVAELKPSYISIATPYDEEFLPVLKTWVQEARKYNLKVWFRGNWSSWEGWFGYPKFSDYGEHHRKTFDFITSQESLFKDGDIFSPVMEPENGGMGDPRLSHEKAIIFREFLIDSYSTCMKAASQIKPKITCGYFSVNGDIARDILTPDVVAKTGKILVIDHYVKTAKKLSEDIEMYYKKFNVPIVLGEVGGPIPDIHGEMTETEQSVYISEVFSELIKLGDKVKGVNYWTAFGGSTRIYENTLEPRLVSTTISRYYNPPKLIGVVTDQYGNRLDQSDIFLLNGAIKTTSDSQGMFSIPFPGTFMELSVNKEGQYETYSDIISSNGQPFQIKNIQLHRNANVLTKVWLQFVGFLSKVKFIFFQN